MEISGRMFAPVGLLGASRLQQIVAIVMTLLLLIVLVLVFKTHVAPLPSASSASGQCLALLDDGGLKKEKKVNDRRGGSAPFEYNNRQMNALKAFRAPARKLTDAEI